jgi:hypothetical protein
MRVTRGYHKRRGWPREERFLQEWVIKGLMRVTKDYLEGAAPRRISSCMSGLPKVYAGYEGLSRGGVAQEGKVPAGVGL